MKVYDSFYKYLEDLNLEPAFYEPLSFTNESKLFRYLDDILKHNRRVLLYGDYDPDGASFILIFRDFFNQIGFTNYTIFPYGTRTHMLDNVAVVSSIEKKCDYIIVGDTGTSADDLDKLSTLNSFGIKAIVIDHHVTKLKYANFPKDCAVVSSYLENTENFFYKRNSLTVSGGCLGFLVLDKYIRKTDVIKGVSINHLACYAVFSLYADSIDMSSALNRALYQMCITTPIGKVPNTIKFFLSEYQTLCRRFFEFDFTPKLNSAFRMEEFKVINDMMTNITPYQSRVTNEYLQELHNTTRAMTKTIADSVDCEVFNNFVISDLNSVSHLYGIDDFKLYNYTGLVGNMLANFHSKPAIVLCPNAGAYKGSFRDILGRDYLSIFSQFSHSAGHNAAFGIILSRLERSDFINYVRMLDKRSDFGEILKPLVFPIDDGEPDLRMFAEMAKYNEFAGNKNNIALIEKVITPDMKEYKNDYNYSYRWGSIYVKSPNRLTRYTKVLLRPTLGKSISLRTV